MLQSLQRLFGAPTDQTTIEDEALAAVEAGDAVAIEKAAKRLTDDRAQAAVHELAERARRRREDEAARVLAEKDRAARRANIEAATAERAAAAAEADQAVAMLSAAWQRILDTSQTIHKNGVGELDTHACVLGKFELETALRGALARPGNFGNFFTWPIPGVTPPTLEDRFAEANAETLMRAP